MKYSDGYAKVVGGKIVYQGKNGKASYPIQKKPVPVSQEKLHKEYWGVK